MRFIDGKWLPVTKMVDLKPAELEKRYRPLDDMDRG
jgi:hypothetical protein